MRAGSRHVSGHHPSSGWDKTMINQIDELGTLGKRSESLGRRLGKKESRP